MEITSVALLPFGKGQSWLRRGISSKILGGWLFGLVMSGVSFTVTSSGNLNANGSGQTADLVAPFHLTHRKPPRTDVTCGQNDPSSHYFSVDYFAAPLITSAADAYYGNTKRNEFRSPGYFSANLSVVRDFKIKESAALEVRADALDLINTPHFANPNISCSGSPTTPEPVAGIGGLCSTGNNNFGVITGTAFFCSEVRSVRN